MDRVHWQTVELLSPVPRGQWALGTELVVARNSAPANEAVAGRCQPGPSQKPEGTPLLFSGGPWTASVKTNCRAFSSFGPSFPAVWSSSLLTSSPPPPIPSRHFVRMW